MRKLATLLVLFVTSTAGTALAEDLQISASQPTAGLPAISTDGKSFVRPVKVQPTGCTGIQTFVEVGTIGGPTTDAMDLLTPLVAWVERGEAPASIVASVRGPGHPLGANTDVPAEWSPTRTRPLCPYPKIARYNGTGNIESAASFACQ